MNLSADRQKVRCASFNGIVCALVSKTPLSQLAFPHKLSVSMHKMLCLVEVPASPGSVTQPGQSRLEFKRSR